VIKEPEIRREMSQLQRCVGKGSEDAGTLKVWLAALHIQATVSCLLSAMVKLDLERGTMNPQSRVARDCTSKVDMSFGDERDATPLH
jgi:hypothetical protein